MMRFKTKYDTYSHTYEIFMYMLRIRILTIHFQSNMDKKINISDHAVHIPYKEETDSSFIFLKPYIKLDMFHCFIF